jgi:transcriptional regulator with XRE-family HTH domain
MSNPKIISNWLNTNGDPSIKRFVRKNLAISKKVFELLDEKGMKSSDLATLLGKSQAEISKWLSGSHNLTLKSITKIEEALKVELFHIEPKKEYVYLKIRVNDEIEAEAQFEQSNYDDKIASNFY